MCKLIARRLDLVLNRVEAVDLQCSAALGDRHEDLGDLQVARAADIEHGDLVLAPSSHETARGCSLEQGAHLGFFGFENGQPLLGLLDIDREQFDLGFGVEHGLRSPIGAISSILDLARRPIGFGPAVVGVRNRGDCKRCHDCDGGLRDQASRPSRSARIRRGVVIHLAVCYRNVTVTQCRCAVVHILEGSTLARFAKPVARAARRLRRSVVFGS